MREAIGGTWLFGIVIVFIVLFSGYLAISINYTKAFKVKNEIISIIEECGNLAGDENTSGTTQYKINEALENIGYYVYSTCSVESEGHISSSKGYKYCVTKRTSEGNLNKSYYKVTVFFRLDLPIFGDLFVFPVSGETKAIINADDRNGTCN